MSRSDDLEAVRTPGKHDRRVAASGIRGNGPGPFIFVAPRERERDIRGPAACTLAAKRECDGARVFILFERKCRRTFRQLADDDAPMILTRPDEEPIQFVALSIVEPVVAMHSLLPAKQSEPLTGGTSAAVANATAATMRMMDIHQ